MNSNQVNAERFCRSAFFLILGVFFQSAIGQQNDLGQRNAIVNQPSQSSSQNKNSTDEATTERIKQWIDELTNRSFLIRQNAKSNLQKAGAAAYGQLYRAKNIADLEAKLTIEELLAQVQIQWVGDQDSQRVIDLMLDFQTRKPSDRLAIVDRLSWYSQEESWQPLYRIVLYDSSVNVSNHAASRLLEVCFLRDERPAFGVRSDYKTLSSQRYTELLPFMDSDARWGEKMLAVCFSLTEQPTSILDPTQLFGKSVKTQKAEVQQAIAENALDSQRLHSILLAQRVLYQMYEQLGKSPKITENVGTELDSIVISSVNDKTLAPDRVAVVDCLLNHSRFAAAQKIAQGFTANKWLWYEAWRLEVLRRWGKADQALELATAWLKNVPQGADDLDEGIGILGDWRLDYWAVFVLTNRIDTISIRQKLKLAELEQKIGQPNLAQRHAESVFASAEDQQDRLQSAAVLTEIFREKNDQAGEFKWLKEVLKFDPTSTFALVRLFELSKTSPDLKLENLRNKIDLAKGAFRDQFRLGSQMSQSSTPAEANLGRAKMGEAANSLAWLLFNLNEELSEAMQVAETAVRLEPFNANYLDTLAWGLYRAGNKKRAVELQKRAVFLDPGDRSKKRQLQKFVGNN